MPQEQLLAAHLPTTCFSSTSVLLSGAPRDLLHPLQSLPPLFQVRNVLRPPALPLAPSCSISVLGAAAFAWARLFPVCNCLSVCFSAFFICCSSGSSADLFHPRWKSASCLTMTIWAKDTFCTPSILKKKKPQERCLESDKFPASLLWLKTLFSFTLKHICTPSPSPRSSDWVGGVFVYIRNSTERSASCRLHPGHRSWHVLPISNVSMMWFLFHRFCLLSCIILATVSPCFSLFFCYLCPLFIGVAPNHTITLIALFLIFSPHVQKCKMSLIFQIYFQQSSAKVTKNVRAEKASRGGSVWTLLLFKHSKAFYKPLSLFFFFFSTNQRRVANCAE